MTHIVKPEVVGLGQCSLDFLGQLGRYPELDQKAELSSLLVQGGGPVATAMVALARLGIRVAMFGAVGDDIFGRQIRLGLSEEKVDCTHLLQQAGAASQVAFVAVDQDGHRNIFWHRGTAAPVVDRTFGRLLADGVKVLHLDGLHLEAALSAATEARTQGVVTILDAGTLRPGTEKLLPLIDHLVVSEKFARQLTGGDVEEEALRKLLQYGAQAVTVTRGRSGSLSLSRDGQMISQDAFPVKIVDTTGCGDVFHGGYIYGLLRGWPLARMVRFATACAALKAGAMGGRTAIPGLPAVEAFLRERPA